MSGQEVLLFLKKPLKQPLQSPSVEMKKVKRLDLTCEILVRNEAVVP